LSFLGFSLSRAFGNFERREALGIWLHAFFCFLTSLGLKNPGAVGLGLKTRRLGAEENGINTLSPMFSARLLQPVIFSPKPHTRQDKEI
jgi:hypothetical protein